MQREEYIVSQPYIKVIQEVGSIGKTTYKDNRQLYLYEDELVTAYRKFDIKNVLDISFKDIQGKGGILFVHTDHGVYSYTIETSPDAFINAFKKIKGTE